MTFLRYPDGYGHRYVFWIGEHKIFAFTTGGLRRILLDRRRREASSPGVQREASAPSYQETSRPTEPTQPYSDARVSVLREGELPTRVVEGSGFTIRNHREAA